MNDLNDYYRIKLTAKKLEDQECRHLAPYALKTKERRVKLKEQFREHRPSSPLEHRTGYHRDRDRILWSKAFKRLQNKTQVFPHYVEDHYKRRLTHSLEVAQIATTVARALRLNETATEAMALGHDLGHTPFGHAGERALNEILTTKSKVLDGKIKKEIEELKKAGTNNPVPIFGFDHCVHAIEVVSRIEKEYDHETNKYGGLNLTVDVRDGILKHMCSRNDEESKEMRPFSSISRIVTTFDKYEGFEKDKGSLEAQCVYFADKVTYLLGDIEDGIRSGILKCELIRKETFFDLLETKLKDYRSSETKLKLEEPDDFSSFRSTVLTILILNCIDNTNKNIAGILSIKNRVVFISDDLSKAWKEFYEKWMVNYLFKNERVEACTFKAMKVLTDLFNAYFEYPGLITKKYYTHCEEVYQKIGISDKKLLKLIIVRNYIAGMTDAFATAQHTRLFMSSEPVTL